LGADAQVLEENANDVVLAKRDTAALSRAERWGSIHTGIEELPMATERDDLSTTWTRTVYSGRCEVDAVVTSV
jgi:hypothetical protein